MEKQIKYRQKQSNTSLRHRDSSCLGALLWFYVDQFTATNPRFLHPKAKYGLWVYKVAHRISDGGVAWHGTVLGWLNRSNGSRLGNKVGNRNHSSPHNDGDIYAIFAASHIHSLVSCRPHLFVFCIYIMFETVVLVGRAIP